MRMAKASKAHYVWFAAVAASVLFAVFGCDSEHCPCGLDDNMPPAVPTGVNSITGDGYVIVYWNPVYEEDLAGYGVYRSLTEFGKYTLIGVVYRDEDTEFEDDNVANGVTYYYAVDAFDYSGNESELSYETVDDTPRPEGWDLAWCAKQFEPDEAGIAIVPETYDTPVFLPYNSAGAQYYLDAEDVACMRIMPRRDALGFPNLIQDYGYAASPDEVSEAPTQGWSACDSGVEVILKHVYILKTSTGYYGKIWVSDISRCGVFIYWAFQGKKGSTELMLPRSNVSLRRGGDGNDQT
jgi:hypothetical protein